MAEQLSGKVGSTIQDQPSALHSDPFAVAPLVGQPLGIFTGSLVTFPSEYRRGRPRLIDVWDSSFGFNADTDCSRLRAMDAILTILWNWDPVLLHAFYAPMSNESWIVTWNRFTGTQERFDMEIKRWGAVVTLSLYEKTIRSDGVARRNKDPYVRITYKYQSWDCPMLDYNQWDFHWSSIAESKNSIVIPSPHPEATEDQARRVARHLLLSRPWEDKPGVKFEWSSESRDSKQRREFRRCHSVLPDWVYTGTQDGAELNNKGYPSKLDE